MIFLKKKNKKSNKIPRAALPIFLLISLIFLVTGCGCSVRTITVDSNIKGFDAESLAVACINNLENGNPGKIISSTVPDPDTTTGKEYISFKNGEIPDRSSSSVDRAKSLNNGIAAPIQDPNFNARFSDKNDFYYSKIDSIDVAFSPLSNPVCVRKDLGNPTLPTDANNPGYKKPSYTIDSNGRQGILAFNGIALSNPPRLTWKIHLTNADCPSDPNKNEDFFTTDLLSLNNSVDIANIALLQRSKIYLRVGVNSNSNDTNSYDATHYLVFGFVLNSEFFYTDEKTAGNDDTDINSDSNANGTNLGQSRSQKDLDRINAKFSDDQLYKKSDNLNNILLLEGFYGYSDKF